jgi:hypothetical protein
MKYDKLESEFHSVIAHAAAGSDFDEIDMAVRGCVEEVKKREYNELEFLRKLRDQSATGTCWLDAYQKVREMILTRIKEIE